jgi:hypothetical protein
LNSTNAFSFISYASLSAFEWMGLCVERTNQEELRLALERSDVGALREENEMLREERRLLLKALVEAKRSDRDSGSEMSDDGVDGVGVARAVVEEGDRH